MVRSRGGARKPLERPFTRRRLIRELALTDETHVKLAEKYGVQRESISVFKKRHLAEIEAVRAQADDEFAGIHIADKANRLSMYEQIFEEAWERRDFKAGLRCLRSVAEELGHLPSRMQITGAVDVRTSYTITGPDGAPIDVKDLT